MAISISGNRLRAAALGLCFLFVSSAASAMALPPACDPHVADLSAVEKLIPPGNFGKALALLDAILIRDPNDFHAQFLRDNIAILQVDAADQSRGSKVPPSAAFNTAIGALRTLAQRLPAIEPICAARQDFNRIYNIIGAEYLNRVQLVQSECYLLKAYDAYRSGPVNATTRMNVLNNLALTYHLQKNDGLSRAYYEDAAKVGSAMAKYELGNNTTLRAATVLAHEPTDASRESAACTAAQKLP